MEKEFIELMRPLDESGMEEGREEGRDERRGDTPATNTFGLLFQAYEESEPAEIEDHLKFLITF